MKTTTNDTPLHFATRTSHDIYYEIAELDWRTNALWLMGYCSLRKALRLCEGQ
jgi:hypothetical protein